MVEATPETATEPLIPVEPVFQNTDVRERKEEQEEKERKREKKRSSLTMMLQVYKQENLGSGTRALREYLRTAMVPRKTIKELIPEELSCLSV